jgi:hypothetical protein
MVFADIQCYELSLNAKGHQSVQMRHINLQSELLCEVSHARGASHEPVKVAIAREGKNI